MEQIASRNLGQSSKDAQKLVDKANHDEAVAKAKAAAAKEKARLEAEAKAKAEAERIAAEQAAAQEAARQAQIAEEARIAAERARASYSPPAAVSSYVPGDNEAMNFIFMHESTNNPAARNAGGCLGLGQACPGQKLINACPNYANDVPCQIAFFTQYANSRYGGWGGAYTFWVNNHWW
jgi:membrane protein involved in colicin uptake